MKTFNSKPLIRNATPPWDLFDETEISLMMKAVKRSFALQRWGAKPKVSPEELEAVKELFDLAGFHGYLQNGIGTDGKIRWAVICEPTGKEMQKHMVVVTLKNCEECGRKFQAKHYAKFNPKYPGTEVPPDLCDKCGRKATKEQKRLEKETEKQPKIPF